MLDIKLRVRSAFRQRDPCKRQTPAVPGRYLPASDIFGALAAPAKMSFSSRASHPIAM